MKALFAAALACALVFASSASLGADPTAVDKALAAAKLAVDAADRAERAAQAAKDAAIAAQLAAENAKAAALAAGLKAVPITSPQVTSVARNPSVSDASLTKGGDSNPFSAYVTANTEGGNGTIKFEKFKELENIGSTVQTFTLSTPLASGSKSADVATLDGLASGASIGYSYTSNRLVNLASADIMTGGVQGRIGYKRFKYLDQGALASGSADRFSTSLAPYLGYKTDIGNATVLFQGKFDFQRAYKDAESKVLCPQPTSFPVTCVNGPAGEPSVTTKRITSLTMRFKSEPATGEVTLSYDQASKVKGIDVPIYFIQSKEGDRSVIPFNAGVRLGWRSDTRDASVGIFVGSPFKLYGP